MKKRARRTAEEVLLAFEEAQAPPQFDRMTDRARRVLTLASKEASRLNHHYIGTEHLLLGLIAEGEGLGATVLRSLGVDLAKARKTTETVLRGPRR